MEEAKKVPETKEQMKNKSKVEKKAVKETKVAKEPAKRISVKKDAGASAKENLVARAKKFLRSAYLELKKVSWLGRKELITFTIVVLVSVVIVGAAIFVVDSLLSNVLSLIIK